MHKRRLIKVDNFQDEFITKLIKKKRFIKRSAISIKYTFNFSKQIFNKQKMKFIKQKKKATSYFIEGSFF